MDASNAASAAIKHEGDEAFQASVWLFSSKVTYNRRIIDFHQQNRRRRCTYKIYVYVQIFDGMYKRKNTSFLRLLSSRVAGGGKFI